MAKRTLPDFPKDEFVYWKRPGYKWVVLAAAVLQILCLWMNVREYNRIFAAGILSASEWEAYAASKIWQCALNGLLVYCFAGSFMIGMFVKSRREARMAETVFSLILALAWGAAGFLLHLFSASAKGAVWALILLIAIGGAVYNFWLGQKE